MPYDTPYRVETARYDHRDRYEIHRVGVGCVAAASSIVLAHRIVEMLNEQEQLKHAVINPDKP